VVQLRPVNGQETKVSGPPVGLFRRAHDGLFGSLRRLYDWVLHWANTRFAIPALLVLAFVESSFFPIPPDVLLIALALSIPKHAFRFAALCTLGSVVGGLAGYGIGFGLWHLAEPWVMSIPGFSAEKFDKVMGWYREYGVLTVFVAAFTPIPYKVFTIAAGVAGLPLWGFLGASLVGRGGRFFLVALVVRLFGQRAKALIDRYFNLVTVVATVLLVGGFALLKLL
jgi:membrane protein YqaA with SNARE-associated domain